MNKTFDSTTQVAQDCACLTVLLIFY